MINRYKLFDTPHKALRLALSDLLTLAGKTDFTQTNEVLQLIQNMKEVFNMIHAHSHHEDDIFFASLDQIAPHATDHDRNEHERLHMVLDTLLLQIEEILKFLNMGKDTSTAGDELYASLCQLHVEMLNHMIEEERDTQPLFWKHMTDEQLHSFQPRIMAAMTLEQSALWLRYIFPSHPQEEVRLMLMGVKETVPAEMYERVLDIAKATIPKFSVLN